MSWQQLVAPLQAPLTCFGIHQAAVAEMAMGTVVMERSVQTFDLCEFLTLTMCDETVGRLVSNDRLTARVTAPAGRGTTLLLPAVIVSLLLPADSCAACCPEVCRQLRILRLRLQ